jgi:acyl-CoA thioester hydrolase
VTAFKFSTEVRVRLPETDALGVVFHGYFYTYFDVARMDYLRNLGLLEMFRSGTAKNLIVHATADFRSPAKFDDVLVIHARVSDLGHSSLTFQFRVTNKRDARLVAEGKSVHCMIDPGTWRPVPVPDEFRKAIRLFEGGELLEK